LARAAFHVSAAIRRRGNQDRPGSLRSAKAGRGCRISRLRERSSRLRLLERDEVYGRSCGFAANVTFAFKPLHLLRSCALSLIIRQNRRSNKTFCTWKKEMRSSAGVPAFPLLRTFDFANILATFPV
jgi:hypothetical protein